MALWIFFLATIPSNAEPGAVATTYTYLSQLVNMFVGLGAVLLVLFASIWVMKKISRISWLKPTTTPHLLIKERRVLSNKSTLYVVEMDGIAILLAESPAGVSVIHQRELLEEPTPLPEADPSRFFIKDRTESL